MRYLLLLVLSCRVFALYNGNPAEPEMIDRGVVFSQDNWGALKVGYQGDYAFDLMLRAYDGTHGRIDDFQVLMNQGVIMGNFAERAEVYVSLGAFQAKIAHRPTVDDRRRVYETGNDLTWGAGIRAILFYWGTTLLGIDGKYQWAYPDLSSATLNGASEKTAGSLQYVDWQVSVSVSHHIDIFTPYVALKYEEVQAELKHLSADILPHSHFKMHTRQPVGIALGCSLTTAKYIDLNVEVRLIDEEAITLAGNFKF